MIIITFLQQQEYKTNLIRGKGVCGAKSRGRQVPFSKGLLHMESLDHTKSQFLKYWVNDNSGEISPSREGHYGLITIVFTCDLPCRCLLPHRFPNVKQVFSIKHTVCPNSLGIVSFIFSVLRVIENLSSQTPPVKGQFCKMDFLRIADSSKLSSLGPA